MDVKRKAIFTLARVVAVLLLPTVLILLSGADPIRALQAFLSGIFGSAHGFTEVFVRATPLIFLGLGVAITFRTGFFNLGAEGQLYMGALASTAVVLLLPASWGSLRLPIALVSAFLAGGIWVLFPAWMKSRLGISETVNTIMFNYIAIMLVGICIRTFLQEPGSTLPQTAIIPEDCILPLLLYPTRFHAGTILSLVAAVLAWFFLCRTTTGFEMQMVGMNKRAALCTGLSVPKSLLLSAVIGGGLAGLAGFNEVFGVQHRLLEGVSGGNGYTAILVALLALNHPLRVVLMSVGLAALQVGAATMQRTLGIPNSIVSIIIGFIVLMILCGSLPEILEENHPILRKRKENIRHVE